MQRFGFKWRWIAQVIPLVVLGGLLVWYFGPRAVQSRELFSQRNFRALALAGDRLRSSIESFPKALEVAAQSQERSTKTNAIELSDGVRDAMTLAPLLQLVERPNVTTGQAPSKSTTFSITNVHGKTWLAIQYKGPSGSNTNLSVTIHARCDLQHLLGNSAEFDGLMLARSDGAVLVDSLPAGLRLARLDALRDGGNQPVDSNLLAGASQALEVKFGGEPYRLFSQPMSLDVRFVGQPGTDWLLCGLVSVSRFDTEVRAIAHVYWTWGLYLALLAVFSGPFCRFFFMDPRERLTRWNVRWLVINSVVLVALLSLAWFSMLAYWSWEEKAKDNLCTLGGNLATNLQSELVALHDQLVRIDTLSRTNGEGTNQPVVNLLTNTTLVPTNDLSYCYFHTVSWVNSTGTQTRKWTTRRFSTPFLDVKERNYFRDAFAEEHSVYAWRGPLKNFWVEPIYAYYSGENSVMVSIRADGGGRTNDTVVTMDAPLISVAAPVMRAGYGFCVVAGDGRVLLHCEPRRNLRENLFDECDGDQRLVRLVRTRKQGHIEDIRYRGHVHSFNVQPLPHQPWSLVVFRDERPISAVNFNITIVTLVLLAGWFLVLGVLVLLAWGVLRLLRAIGVNRPWQALPDSKRSVLGMLRPDYEGRSAYLAVTLWNLAVTMVTLAWVLTTNSTGAMAVAVVCGAVLGLGGAVFGLAVRRGFKLAVWIGVRVRKAIRQARRRETSVLGREAAAPRGYACTLVSLLLLLGVIPSITCQRIAYELGARFYVQDGMWRMAEALTRRAERVTAEYRGFERPPDFIHQRVALTNKPGGDGAWDIYAKPFFTGIKESREVGASAGPTNADLFAGLFDLVGSDEDLPLLSATAATDQSWKLAWTGSNKVELVHGGYQVSADIPRWRDRWGWWGVALTAVGMGLLGLILARFIVRRIMLVHVQLERPVELAGFLVKKDTGHLLVLDDAVSADEGTLQQRLGAERWAALQEESQAIHDLRQGPPPEELTRKLGGLVVLDHFEHGWNDSAFNRTRHDWIERVLTQGGPTLVLISTLHPDHFTAPEAESNPGEKPNTKRQEPVPGSEWPSAFRIAYLHSATVPRSQTATQNEARYRNFWATCSKDEQLVLAHLATDGLIPPRNRELCRLLGRGLVVNRPRVRLFDDGFSRFARAAGDGLALRRYERASVHSLWGSMRLPLVLLLLGVFLILNWAQPNLYTGIAGLLPVLGVLGPAIQKVKGLLALIGGDNAARSA